MVWYLFSSPKVARSILVLANGSTLTDGRERKQDRPLMLLTTSGMIVVPFLYLFTARLDFADYSLPATASLTAGSLGAAHLLWAVAQLLLLQNWIAGPAFLVASLPLYVVRIPREEEMMVGEFGEESQVHGEDRAGGAEDREIGCTCLVTVSGASKVS
jgi:hypothetical protein